MNAARLRRDPIRLAFCSAPWSSARYLLGYLFAGAALCTIACTVACAGAMLGLTLVGLPALVAAAGAVRWCADVERRRQRPPLRAEGRYRRPAGPGVLTAFRTRWGDPATWRDLAYLLGVYLPLAALDLIVLTVWLTCLAGITLPAWYWAPWQSIHGTRFHGYELGVFLNGPHAQPAYGFYIDSLPKALATAGVFLVLFLGFNYVLIATARVNARVARALLGRLEDPLRPAKEVLLRPGPLAAAIPDKR
jgi:hypothetical protein